MRACVVTQCRDLPFSSYCRINYISCVSLALVISNALTVVEPEACLQVDSVHQYHANCGALLQH